MAALLGLIEGAFGALIMVVFGLLTIVSVPVAIFGCVYPAISGKTKTTSYYVKWACLPFACFAVSVFVFILRASISLFFGAAPIALF